jgi:S1-C subfamily serine protease
MTEEKQKPYVVIVLAVVVALLVGCIAGALAGGAAGFLVGRRQARNVVQPTLPSRPFAVPAVREGALVTNVVAGSPAEQAGLQAGDVIVAIDRTPVDQNHPLPDVIAQYQPGDRATVHFWRAGQEQSVQVKLAQNPENPGQAYLGIYFRMISGSGSGLPGD